jgi:hypothetical protein
MIILLSSILVSFCTNAFDVDLILEDFPVEQFLKKDALFPNKAEVDAKMTAIFQGLARGVVGLRAVDWKVTT